MLVCAAVFSVCMALPEISHAGVINLNTVTKAELLESSIDMNRAMVNNLIKYREEHGPFHSVDDLLKVKGINDALILRIGIYKDENGDMVVDVPDEDTPEGMTVPLY